MAVSVDHIPAHEVQCLSQALYREARGEPVRGQKLVARVIVNRTKAKGFPKTICGVVNQKGQFTYNHREKITNRKEFDVSKQVAYEFLSKEAHQHTVDPVLYFHGSHMRPKWKFKELRKYAAVGKHVFYTKRNA